MIEKRTYPWFGVQTWEHILFAHWQVPAASVLPYIPAPLQLDTYAGSAWLSIVSFQANDSRLRFCNRPLIKRATQINVRTYVTYPNSTEKGVYFFALHINQLAPKLAAQLTMALPFTYVTTSVKKQGASFHVHAQKAAQVLYDVQFTTGEKAIEQDALSTFLTERYAIWHTKGKRCIKIPILHEHWTLKEATATVTTNVLHPLTEARQPDLVHYARSMEAKLFPFETYGFVQ